MFTYRRWKSDRRLARFFTRLAGLLRSGLTLHTSLTLLSEQAPKGTSQEIRQLIQGVENGLSLSSLLQRHRFHPMSAAMATVGEKSGNLQQAFSKLSDYYQTRYDRKQKMIGALIYPLIVFAVMILAGVFVLYGILPRFENMYQNLGFALPPTTSTLFSSAAVIRYQLPFIITGLMVFLCCLVMLRGMIYSRFPRAASIVLSMPIIKQIWRIWMSYRLAESISVLLTGGVSLLHALETAEQISLFSLEKKIIASVQESILSGKTLAESLRAENWFDPMLIHALHAAEASGDLAGVCGFAAKEFENDIQRLTDRMVQLIEPTMILGLGAGIGMIILSVVMPMMEMVSSI